MNQLQKDLEIAISWFSFIPLDKLYQEDVNVMKRLEAYMKKDLDYETYTGEYIDE